MSSGNPAKRSIDAVVKEIRAGIRKGRTPVVHWSDSTSIAIKSTSEDEAEFLVRSLNANPVDIFEAGSFEAWVQTTQFYGMVYAANPEHSRAVKKLGARLSQ